MFTIKIITGKYDIKFGIHLLIRIYLLIMYCTLKYFLHSGYKKCTCNFFSGKNDVNFRWQDAFFADFSLYNNLLLCIYSNKV